MSIPYICASCRLTVRKSLRATRLHTWHFVRKVHLHSLVDLVPPALDDPQLPSRTLSDKRVVRQPSKASSEQYQRFDGHVLGRSSSHQPGRYSRRACSEDELAAHFSPGQLAESVPARAQWSVESRKVRAEIGTPDNGTDASEKKTTDAERGHLPLEKEHLCTRATGLGSLHQSRLETLNSTQKSQNHDPAVTQLKAMLLDSACRSLDTWEFFKKCFPSSDCLLMTHPTLQERASMNGGGLFSKLLQKMTAQWAYAEDSRLPNPVTVVQKLQSLKVMRPAWYSNVLWRLITVAIGKYLHVAKTSYVSQKVLQKQIAGIWALFFEEFTKDELRDSSIVCFGYIDWNGLPRLLEKELYEDAKEGNIPFAQAEQAMTSRVTVERDIGVRLTRDLRDIPRNVLNQLAASAVLSFTILTEPRDPAQSAVMYEPLIRYLARLLYRADIQKAMDFLLENDQFRISSQYTSSQIEVLQRSLNDVPARITAIFITDSRQTPLAEKGLPLTLERDEILEAHFKKKIAQRLKNKSTSQLLDLWAHAQQVYSKTTGSTGLRSGQLPPKLYTKFLRAFSELNRTDVADEIWNHMVAVGFQPSRQHWGALIKGRSRNAHAVEEIWGRMLAAGIQPDVYLWTARIRTLLSYAKTVEQGLRAMDQMGSTWLKAVEKIYGSNKVDLASIGDLPDAPKPNEVTLNAAVDGLVNRKKQKQDRQMFPRIFEWAYQFGIKPNTRTYNALIKECLADSNLKEAMTILRRMEKEDAQPDGATLGMFINYIFRQSQKTRAPMSTDQQEATLQSILTILEKRGMSDDSHTLCLIFDILVKQHNNLLAAQEILVHMSKRGMKPSPHIYTILLTHYFQKADDPDGSGSPDFPAIEALWARIQTSGAVVDHIFYDRMIEGYARAGEVGAAMTFLGRMGKESRKPGWQALTFLVRALVHGGQLDRVREVVDDVENFEGMLRGGARGSNHYTELFWDEIVKCGIRTPTEVIGGGVFESPRER